MEIKVKSFFEPRYENDGYRILVGAIWPKGLKKTDSDVDLWIKELAPSTDLRKWFAYDPEKWDEFMEDYFFQLNRNREVTQQFIAKILNYKKVSLLYIAQNDKHNYALALKSYLDRHFTKQ